MLRWQPTIHRVLFRSVTTALLLSGHFAVSAATKALVVVALLSDEVDELLAEGETELVLAVVDEVLE